MVMTWAGVVLIMEVEVGLAAVGGNPFLSDTPGIWKELSSKTRHTLSRVVWPVEEAYSGRDVSCRTNMDVLGLFTG